MYYADSGQVSIFLVASLVIPLYALPFILGFRLSRMIRNRGAWFILLVLFVVAQVAEFVLLFDRYNTVSSYYYYQIGVRVPIQTTSLAYVLTGMTVLVIGAGLTLFMIGLKLQRHDKQA